MQDHTESAGEVGQPELSLEECTEGAAGHRTANNSHKAGIATEPGRLQKIVGGTRTGVAGTCCWTRT